MKGPGIGIKATALFIALSVIPLSAGGYLLTEASMHELSSKTIEGLTDVVRGKANLYSEEFLNFKEDAESLSKYTSNTWNQSHGNDVNRSYVWISPDGTGYDAHEDELKNFKCITDGFELAVGATSKVELAYFGTESGVLFFNKPVSPIIEELKPFEHRERPWYTTAKEKNDTIWTSVYVDANTKKLVTTVATPVYMDGEFAGVVGLDLLLETMQQDILDLKFADSGYAILVDNSGDVVVHPDYTARNKRWNETFTGENVLDMGSSLEEIGREMIDGKEGVKEITIDGKNYYVSYSPVHGINGSIAFFVEDEKIAGAMESLREKMYIGIIILTGAIAILGIFLASYITRPIEELTKGAEEVAKGNLDYRIESKSGDEIGILTDSFNRMVEELKNSRKRIKESEKRYRELFESSKDEIYVMSKDGRLIDMNKAGEELLGYTKEELLNMDAADIYEDRKDREKFIKEIEEKGFVKDYEVNYRRKDGKIITCLETASVKRDEAGNVIGYQGLVKDVTKLREAEKRAELYNSLMRHDMGNRAQIARGYMEVLKDTELTEEQKKFVDRAIKMIEESQEMTQKVRNIDRARDKHKLGRFKLDEIIEKALSSYIPHAEENGITIEYDGKGGEVIADEMADDIFSNIIGNAIEHSGCSRIKISVNDEKEFYRVTIEDNGKGIPRDMKDKIFKWGFRGRESRGSGLGLYLVKTIVESYGGRVELRNGKGGGATFDIYLRKWKDTDE